MKAFTGFVGLVSCAAALAAPAARWLTVDNEVLAKTGPKMQRPVQALFSAQGASVVKMTPAEVGQLSGTIHDELHRCGGFIVHGSFEEARTALSRQGDMAFAKRAVFVDYSIDQQKNLDPMVAAVDEKSIRDMVTSLVNFGTRYCDSASGVKSSKFIRDTWANLSKHRSDVKLELVSHAGYAQPSVIMTIQGSKKADEIVILGGHADSIANGNIAPGADDNASGIASITEVIRVLMSTNYRPERTVQLMAYAAEEVGLAGSGDIAYAYRKANKQVVGVLQLDMTLFKGTKDKDIFIMSDYTNQPQNEFMGKLIDEYVKVPWGYSRCGYGCSDHASWTGNGYPSSFSFESDMRQYNPKIHSAQDTLQNAGGDAKHAVKFAKLGLAFVVEMAK